jgi:hypothetical protein
MLEGRSLAYLLAKYLIQLLDYAAIIKLRVEFCS